MTTRPFSHARDEHSEDNMTEPLTDAELKAHADRYFGHLTQKHPWFYEAYRANETIAHQINAGRLKGLTREQSLPPSRPLTVDDEIDFARALRDQPDMWQYFVDWASGAVPELNEGSGDRFDPSFSEVMRFFIQLFFYRRNMWVHSGSFMLGGRAVAQEFVAGKLDTMDGPEARAIASKFSWR